MRSHMRRNSEGTAVFLHDASLSAFILGFSPTQSAWFVHSRHVAENAECFLPDGTLAALNPTLRTPAWTTALCVILCVCVCVCFARFISFNLHSDYFQGPFVCVHLCMCVLVSSVKTLGWVWDGWRHVFCSYICYVSSQVLERICVTWHEHPQWRSKARCNDIFCQNWVANEIGALRQGDFKIAARSC